MHLLESAIYREIYKSTQKLPSLLKKKYNSFFNNAMYSLSNMACNSKKK